RSDHTPASRLAAFRRGGTGRDAHHRPGRRRDHRRGADRTLRPEPVVPRAVRHSGRATRCAGRRSLVRPRAVGLLPPGPPLRRPPTAAPGGRMTVAVLLAGSLFGAGIAGAVQAVRVARPSAARAATVVRRLPAPGPVRAP